MDEAAKFPKLDKRRSVLPVTQGTPHDLDEKEKHHEISLYRLNYGLGLSDSRMQQLLPGYRPSDREKVITRTRLRTQERPEL